MKLLFSGCSYTYGDELQNVFKERFSRLVGDHYGAETTNLGQCGASNDNISRRSIEFLDKNTVDIAVIQFTVHQRIEWFNDKDKPVKFTPQRISNNIQKIYYRDVYRNTLGSENLWKNIFLIDCYCKERGIKNIFLLADHFDEMIKHPERIFEDGVGDWRKLCETIPKTYLHMGCLGLMKNFPQNYINEAGGGHPTALGHQVIADKIIRLIDAI
tara:strand:+ start:669 stop:1310 length:642 start_codon:yes stop_codon:yes gene_type:complete